MTFFNLAEVIEICERGVLDVRQRSNTQEKGENYKGLTRGSDIKKRGSMQDGSNRKNLPRAEASF